MPPHSCAPAATAASSPTWWRPRAASARRPCRPRRCGVLLVAQGHVQGAQVVLPLAPPADTHDRGRHALGLQHPGQGDLAAGQAVLVGYGVHHGRRLARLAEDGFLEEPVLGADAGALLAGAAEAARQQALGQRGVGGDGDVVLAAEGQHVRVDQPPKRIVGRLQADGAVAHGRPHLLQVEVAHAHVARLADVDHAPHLLEERPQFHARARPVDDVDVHVVGLQQAQRLVQARLHLLDRALDDLRVDHGALAAVALGQGAAQHALGVAAAVDVGRVEEVAAAVLHRPDQVDALLVVLGAPARAAAHVPGAQAEAGDLDVGVAKSDVVHCSSLPDVGEGDRRGGSYCSSAGAAVRRSACCQSTRRASPQSSSRS